MRNLCGFTLWRGDGIPAASIARGCFAAGLILQSRCALAQPALRNSMDLETAAAARSAQSENQPYTLKSGDFRLLVVPSLDFQWNNNVTLQEADAQSDFILRPAVGIDLSYPVSDRNLLQLNLTCGYSYYFDHHYLSSLYLASGSQIAFDVFVGDFQFNFHDSIAYSQDSATEAAVSGTGDYGTFQNTAGLSTTWNLGDVTSTLGYDHQNLLATSSEFDYLDQASELLNGRLGLKVYPTVTVGLEATGTFTTYTQHVLNDSIGWSGGAYGEWQPGTFLKVTPRFGYAVYYGQQTSSTVPASNLSTWYADVTVSHQATSFLTYTLSVGHELRPGIQSDVLEDTYVRPNLTWTMIRNVSIGTSLMYETGTQQGGQIANTFGDNYDYYGVGLDASFALLERLNASLYYRLTLRSSDVAAAGYSQDVVGFTLTYALP